MSASAPACPLCGAPLREVRGKAVCTGCGRICEGCCEGAPQARRPASGWRPLLLALALAALLAAGAGIAAAAPAGGPAGSVALGDSYASGEGAGPPWDDGTDVAGNRCHRGPLAWPRLLGVPATGHLACSGAGIAQLASGGADLPPDDRGQLARLEALAPTALVFVTIGGNDAGFGEILRRCVIASCVALIRERAAALPGLGARLEDAYRRVAAAAGGGRVLVVGYPEIIPERPPRGLRCLWLGDAEVAAALSLQRSLDATIAAAAARAGVEFAGVADALDGHELCTPGSWLRPVVLNPFAADAGQAHPRPAGQSAIADAVAAHLAAGQR